MTAVLDAEMSSAELLLAWQTKQTAERSPGLSMSALGGCRRKAGYLIAETEPTNPSGSVQSAMGSAAHDKIAEAAREILPNDLVEYPVEFAGIPGHIDRYHTATRTLIDSKTTSSRWLEHVQAYGISTEWRWQTAGYAAALIAAGHPVHHIRIDVLARDTGEEWQTSRPFDPAEVKEALAWVATVRNTPLDYLSRDYAPESQFCAGCPFRDTCWGGGVAERDERSVLFVEDPDAVKWARQLWDARQAIAAAKSLEAEAKGALDALRPIDAKGSQVVDVGFEKALKWTITEPLRVDLDAVKKEYKATGASPPMKAGSQTIKLEFAPRETSAA